MNANLAVVQTNPFAADRILHAWTPGETVLDIMLAVQPDQERWRGAHVFLNDIEVKPEYYHVVRPHHDTIIAIKVNPQGGDNGVLRAVAFIALAYAAAQTGGAAGALWGGGANWSAATISTYVSAGVYVAGAIAINALIPVASPELDNGDGNSQSLSVGGSRNRIDPYGNLPTLLGFFKYAAPYATRPYSELQGDDQYATMLFALGLKPMEVDIDSISIGETLVSSLDGVQVELDTGGSADSPNGITLVSGTVFQDVVNKQIPRQQDGWAEHTTIEDITSLTFEISFPTGLFRTEGSGDQRKVIVYVQYAETIAGPWKWMTAAYDGDGDNAMHPPDDHDDNYHLRFVSDTSTPIRKGFTWTPPYQTASNQWSLRMSADKKNFTNGDGDGTYNSRYFSVLRSYTDADPVNSDDVALMAVRVKATDQLSGIPDTVNQYCQVIAPDWTGSAWVDGVTQNPSSLVRYLLTGKPNARALPLTRLDDQSFIDFWNYCHDNNLTYNQVIDFNTTIKQTTDSICRAAFSRLEQIDGIWKVITDVPQTTPRQVFTPRNSYGFSASKVFPDPVDGFRVRFIDETDRRFTNDEQIVYADGKNINNATKFEALEAIGITNWDQIWKYARRYLAISVWQPETFTFTVDPEHLVTVVGDLVEYQNDAILVGQQAARIKAISDTEVTLDAEVYSDGVTSYGLDIRDGANQVSVVEVSNAFVSTKTLTFTVPGIYGAVGDLAVFGEYGLVTQQLLIRDISPSTDLSATLTCIPYAEAIYTSDTQTIPPYDPVISLPPGTTFPVISKITSDETVMYRDAGGTYQPRMLVTLAFISERVNVSQIVVQIRKYSTAADNAASWISQPLLPADTGLFNITGVDELEQVELRTRFQFNDGSAGPWGYYYDYDFDTPYHTVVGQTSPPPDLFSLNVIVQASGLREYHWKFADGQYLPPDLDGFQIRYFDSDDLSGEAATYGLMSGDTYGLLDGVNTYGLQFTAELPRWSQMTPLTIGRLTHEPFEYNAPFAGSWYFAIVAYDVGGRESVNPAFTPLITLPPPQLGNSLFYLDHAANNWLEGQTPGAETSSTWQISSITGYLQAVVTNTWEGGSWSTVFPDGWLGTSGSGSFTYTHETGVNTFDPPLSATTDIRLQTTIESNPGGVYTFWYAFDGGGDPVTDVGWTEFFDGDIADNGVNTTTSIEFRIKGSSVPAEGLRNWVVEGYASAGV